MRLQKIARDVFGDKSLVLDDSMKAGDAPGWNSFGHVNFILSVENEFGVEFSEDEFAKFVEIGAVKRMLGEKLAPASAARSSAASS